MLQAFGYQEQQTIKLEAALQATKGVVGLSRYEFEKYATTMSRLTGIADETINGAEALMVTFTKIGKEVMPAALKSAADMSVMFGQDLTQSAIQLGTALNDPIAGVGRLRKIGVSFTQDQQNLIRGNVAQGLHLAAWPLDFD